MNLPDSILLAAIGGAVIICGSAIICTSTVTGKSLSNMISIFLGSVAKTKEKTPENTAD